MLSSGWVVLRWCIIHFGLSLVENFYPNREWHYFWIFGSVESSCLENQPSGLFLMDFPHSNYTRCKILAKSKMAPSMFMIYRDMCLVECWMMFTWCRSCGVPVPECRYWGVGTGKCKHPDTASDLLQKYEKICRTVEVISWTSWKCRPGPHSLQIHLNYTEIVRKKYSRPF